MRHQSISVRHPGESRGPATIRRTSGFGGAFRRQLLGWYDEVARPLPWRRDRDPYRVWVAEVMLQQTRIQVVIPAYQRFLRAFPTPRRLARADEERVLSLWSGLGYYSRARALRHAAEVVCEHHDGVFPTSMAAARGLPGVGPYTAAAVLSIAYGQPYSAVDGNVNRVLSRLARLPLPDGRGEPHRALADRLLDRERPGDWNQAIMELGQTLCLPAAPLCHQCPVRRFCQAHRSQEVALYPPRRPRRRPERLRLRVLIEHDRKGRILLERGAFPHLPHLWLPPMRVVANGVRSRASDGDSFRHSILHREFDVTVRTQLLTAAELRRRAARPARGSVERAVLNRGSLANIGRSSLLTKCLRALD